MTAQENDSPRLRHLGLIQLRVEQGDPAGNLQRLAPILEELAPPPHSLIVLPELWATGFAYQQLPKLRDDVAALPDRLQELAARYDILLAGSLPEPTAEEEMFFNTLRIIGRDGSCGDYRKHQVFPGEEGAFRSWPHAFSPIDTPLGKIGCLICYDLRFPELARRQCQQGADLLLCSAEWPLARISHWRTLVMARAIENQTFVVACNGVGKNGELALGGHSLIVSPAGEVLYEAGDDEEAKIVAIDWQAKCEAQAGFRSFTAAPFLVSAEKIHSPERCVADAELRVRIGQRVVYAALEKVLEFPRTIELLEAARQRADFLVAGVNLPDGEDGGPKSAMARKAWLLPYAVLGCVDAVFDLAEISLADEQRLRVVCRDFP